MAETDKNAQGKKPNILKWMIAVVVGVVVVVLQAYIVAL